MDNGQSITSMDNIHSKVSALPRVCVAKQKPLIPVLSEHATLATHGLERIALPIAMNTVEQEVKNVMVFLNDWWVPLLQENLNVDADDENFVSLEHANDLYGWSNRSLFEMGKQLGVYRSNERKKCYTEKESKAISIAFQGNTVAQFHCYKTWTKTGFGLTTKITGTKFHFDLFEKAIQLLHGAGYDNVVASNIPHAIIKIPSGDGELKCHADFRKNSFEEIKNALDACKTMDEWIKKYGQQILVHVYCGTGSTLGIENLTIDVYRLMMAMLNPHDPFPVLKNVMPFELWRHASDGPNFFNFWDKKILDSINLVLCCYFNSTDDETKSERYLTLDEKAWCEALPTLVSEPLRLQAPRQHQLLFVVRLSPESSTPYLVMWPIGFPHGANAERTRLRYTITVPVDVAANVNHEDIKRRRKRLLALYQPEKQNRKEFTTPESGGITHKRPELIFKYYNEHASFRALFPTTKSEMENILNKFFM